MDNSDSDLSDSDKELQQAFVEGKLKPGLNTVEKAPKKFVNNVEGLKHKLDEIMLDIPWIERLDFTNAQAPLAPELAAQLLSHEQKRENQLKNNKKLPQFKPTEDPVLNDFKREMAFHRQAQATILDALPKIKSLGILTKRPEDYFAEMAKTDDHMQKIRKHLMQKQQQQQRSEKVKQLREQKKAVKKFRKRDAKDSKKKTKTRPGKNRRIKAKNKK